VRVAIPAGRLEQDSIAWLVAMGWNLAERGTRALAIADADRGWDAVAVRPADIPWLVAQGVVDLGIVGTDVLGEAEEELVVGPRLGFGRCRLVVAGPEGAPWPAREPFTLATKYPRQAARFLAGEGRQASVVAFRGAVEVAPMLGVADYIFDLVATGRTLRENGLVELQSVAEVEAVLVASAAALERREALGFWEEASLRADLAWR
jgi:ATP phosphoribosyltransferase